MPEESGMSETDAMLPKMTPGYDCDATVDRTGKRPSREYDLSPDISVSDAAVQLFYALQDSRYTAPPPSTGPAAAQLVLHALAFTGGLLGLIGVIIQTVAPTEYAYFLILGYVAATWVMFQNIFEISSLSFVLRRKKPTPRLSNCWRVIQHAVAVGLTVGGGILAPLAGSYLRQSSDFVKVSMAGLFTAFGCHSILLVWALVDSIPRRRSIALP